MALENLKSAYNNLSINNAKKIASEVGRELSIQSQLKKTEDLIAGRGFTDLNSTIEDIFNPVLSNIDYSARATAGLPFKNLGDNPISAVEDAVDKALNEIPDVPSGGGNVSQFIIDKANKTINALKVRAARELSEAVQVPVIGKPTPFIDLSRGPGETNYIDYVSSQPVTTSEVDDQIAPNKKGDFYVKIKDLRNNNLLYFRGFVTGITENVSPSFTPTNYIGRSEPVYMYERADRDISFNLKIHPANFTEQKLMYDKLEKLTSLAYPEYDLDDNSDSQTRMKPPFTELYMAHIGTRKQGQFGFIKSISYTVPGESDWDALRVLPRLFDINISYQILSKKPPQMNSKFYGYNPYPKEKK
jgi:hypothetical protein